MPELLKFLRQQRSWSVMPVGQIHLLQQLENYLVSKVSRRSTTTTTMRAVTEADLEAAGISD